MREQESDYVSVKIEETAGELKPSVAGRQAGRLQQSQRLQSWTAAMICD